MRNNAVVNHLLASLMLPAVLTLSGASCVKLPRHTSLASSQTPSPVLRQDRLGAPLVNINTASPDEMERLPGIGRALAARIVAHREQHGRFRRAEHLMMVRGISDRRFRSLRAQLTVE